MPHRTTIAAASLLTATAAAGACIYAALSAQSQLFGKVLIAPPNPNEIALTYDDGPNDDATERLLELLARHNTRATFFMIGRYALQRPHIARAVAAAGHLIGNHTMTHPWLAWQSEARIREELTACNKALEDTLGAPIHYFRPPHGARRPAVLRIARELGLTTVQWNLLVQDWKPVDATTIASRITTGITRNQQRHRATNLLLHDGGHTSLGQPRLPTVEATALILNQYKSAANFVTIESWFPPAHPISSTGSIPESRANQS
jgi:peptidoglycan-N-acetylglucosamine deacetylase